MSDGRLAGKTVLITGVRSGIGLATAQRALACGAHGRYRRHQHHGR